MKQTHRLWTATLVLALAAGCTSTGVKPTAEPIAKKLAKPPVLLVYDFAAGPNEFIVDTLGPEFEAEARAVAKGDDASRQAAAAISTHLVDRLKSRGINAERAGNRTTFPLDSVVIKGQILTVDEGSRARRVVLGLGAGRSEMTVQVQAYQATRFGLLRVAQAEAYARGPQTLGMGGPIGVGAAVGTAGTSAVISGSLNVIGELRGGINACAGRVADNVADKIEELYKRQGWL